ncbi:MAG: MFS transporter [Alcanivoracaceae bacterium]
MSDPGHGIPYYWRLSSFYLFYFALLGALVPYWSLYLRDQGFAAVQIGLLMSLPQLTKLVAPNLWGWLADRSGRRLAVIRLGNLAAALVFCAVFLADGFWSMALLLTAFSFFWNAVLAQFEVVTLETLGSRASRYSHVRLWGSVGFIVSVILVGQGLDIFPVTLVPWVILACLWLLWLATLVLPEQPVQGHDTPRTGLWSVLRQPPVLVSFACAFLMQMSHGPYYTFFTIYLTDAGVSGSLTGLLWGLGVAAEVALFLVMHRVLHRFTLEHIITASLGLAALRWLLLAWYADNGLALVIAQLLHAASFGSFHAASIAWVHRAFGGGHAGQGQAFYSSVGFGAGWALGASLSGALWDQYGGDTFVMAAAVAMLAFAISLVGLRPVMPRAAD